jgi:rhodanese-related sulfurtransferase
VTQDPGSPAAPIDAPTLKAWLADGQELALFDVREHGIYGEGHLFHAVPLAYSRLERDVAALAPNPDVRLVVYDDGDGVAQRAASRLAGLGYRRVHRLDGGVAAWSAAGYTLYKGVNVPSKAFGELVEVVSHTPHISAAELAARQGRGEPLVVLDGRPWEEFQKMSIPGGTCCPNGELALRLQSLVPDAATTIVVNCAGRTRSIMGAQTLINLGVPNPVVALENGTQGWFLAGFSLEHGQTRRYPARAAVPAERVRAARDLARRAGVEWVDAAQLHEWTEDGGRTVFLCDVRTPEEYAAGSLRGARSTPGGQLQQATDQYIGVRNATLVLFDDDGVRAAVTASWLRQAGWQAYVLEDGLASGAAVRPTPVYAPPPVVSIDAAALAGALRARTVHVLDVRSSQAYRDAHVPGSAWAIRPRLPRLVRALGVGRYVLVGDDDDIVAWAAADLRELGASEVLVLAGGLAAWRQGGGTVEGSPADPPDAERIDHLFFTHERHSGNRQAAQAYLAWELGLLDQLDAQERASFAPLGH